jgi:CheY-like chemotaxis protein
MLSLNSSFLRQKGFTVTEASDGEQAWALASSGGFDLVLLDVMMPGMSGWEVCKRIKHTPETRGTAVVMLTGIGETLNDMTSSLFSADAWLNKPFDFGELERKLREALSKYGKAMPDGASAFYETNDEPPPSVPAEDVGPALRKASGRKPATARKKSTTKAASPKASAKPKLAAKPVGKKPTAKKPAAKKSASAAAKPATKTSAKKASSKKAPAKKIAAKKPAAKKTLAAPKRSAAKKATSKKKSRR